MLCAVSYRWGRERQPAAVETRVGRVVAPQIGVTSLMKLHVRRDECAFVRVGSEEGHVMSWPPLHVRLMESFASAGVGVAALASAGRTEGVT